MLIVAAYHQNAKTANPQRSVQNVLGKNAVVLMLSKRKGLRCLWSLSDLIQDNNSYRIFDTVSFSSVVACRRFP